MPQELPEVALILIGSTFIILILITLVVVSLLINQKRKFRYSRELGDMKSSFEKEVLRTQLETQLQTLAGVSRELHDNVGTLISMAIIHLQMLQQTEKADGTLVKLNEAGELLKESMGALRDLSHSINPENMDKAGLILVLNKEIEKMKRLKLFAIDFSVKGTEFSIDAHHQIIIFRIMQEAFQNIIKHSRATAIRVQVDYSDGKLAIQINDNGTGFSQSSQYFLDSAENSGIKNMIKRASLIGAKMEIHSTINGGTTLQLVHQAPSLVNT
jgi:signal transduction histidine kinase